MADCCPRCNKWCVVKGLVVESSEPCHVAQTWCECVRVCRAICSVFVVCKECQRFPSRSVIKGARSFHAFHSFTSHSGCTQIVRVAAGKQNNNEVMLRVRGSLCGQAGAMCYVHTSISEYLSAHTQRCYICRTRRSSVAVVQMVHIHNHCRQDEVHHDKLQTKKQAHHIDLLYFNIDLLYFNIDLLHFNIDLLYFNIDLLYFNIDLLYFNIDLLYFNIVLLAHGVYVSGDWVGLYIYLGACGVR